MSSSVDASDVFFVALIVMLLLTALLWFAARSVASSRPSVDRAAPDPETLAIGTRAVRRASGDIPAIKHVREQTGWGLLEAKQYVEDLSAR